MQYSQIIRFATRYFALYLMKLNQQNLQMRRVAVPSLDCNLAEQLRYLQVSRCFLIMNQEVSHV